MTFGPVIGRRYPVRLGRSMLNLPLDQAKQFICISERENIPPESDEVHQKGTSSGKVEGATTSCQIRHDDGSIIKMHLKIVGGTPFTSHMLVFNDDVLYLELVAFEYTVSKEDIKKLANVHPQRLGDLMGRPKYNIVVAPNCFNVAEVRNTEDMASHATTDIPHGASHRSSYYKVCKE